MRIVWALALSAVSCVQSSPEPRADSNAGGTGGESSGTASLQWASPLYDLDGYGDTLLRGHIVVDSGRVYAGTSGTSSDEAAAMIGLDAETGESIWNISWRGDVGDMDNIQGAPVVDNANSQVVFSVGGSSDASTHYMIALDQEDGTQRWRFGGYGMVDHPISWHPGLANGVLATAGSTAQYGHQLYGLDASNGDLLWTADPPGCDANATYSPAVSADEGVAIFAGYNGIVALSIADGAQKWLHSGLYNGYTPIADGNVLATLIPEAGVGIESGSIVAYSVTTGDEAWSIEYSGCGSPDLLGAGSLVLWVECAESSIEAIDPITGITVWSIVHPGARLASFQGRSQPPTVRNDQIVFATEDGHVFALDASTGVVVWEFSDSFEMDPGSHECDTRPMTDGQDWYCGHSRVDTPDDNDFGWAYKYSVED